MKKLASLALALVLVLSLAACGGGSTPAPAARLCSPRRRASFVWSQRPGLLLSLFLSLRSLRVCLCTLYLFPDLFFE